MSRSGLPNDTRNLPTVKKAPAAVLLGGVFLILIVARLLIDSSHSFPHWALWKGLLIAAFGIGSVYASRRWVTLPTAILLGVVVGALTYYGVYGDPQQAFSGGLLAERFWLGDDLPERTIHETIDCVIIFVGVVVVLVFVFCHIPRRWKLMNWWFRSIVVLGLATVATVASFLINQYGPRSITVFKLRRIGAELEYRLLALPRTPWEKCKFQAAFQIGRLIGYEYAMPIGGISLKGTKTIDRTLGGLDRFSELRWLHLDNVSLSKEDLIDLLSSPQLGSAVLNNTDLRGSVLKNLKNARRLYYLNLSDSTIDDASVESLAHLLTCTGLSHVRLDRTLVNDRNLRHFEAIGNRRTYLRSLTLRDCPVSDLGLDRLRKGEYLVQDLALDGTRVTDDGLKALANFSRLRIVTLNSTAITDAGLEHLAMVPSLWGFQVEDTAATENAVQQLTKTGVRPGVSINW